ncbi:MAG: BamA/TamA family outer membrane protein, partial [Salibacteraceae bacterium]
MRWLLVISILGWNILGGWAQERAEGAPLDTIKTNNSTLIGIPVLYYSPETRWAFGAGGIYAFQLGESTTDTRPSQIRFGVVYTQEQQVLLYNQFRLFCNQNRYQVYGELGYYLYNYYFLGIGNDQDPDFEELYDVDYPRFRLTALRQILPNLYVGPRYWYDNYLINNLDLEGQLIDGDITGSGGGVTSALGVVLNWDARDQLFYPRKGHYIEALYTRDRRAWGSDFPYSRASLDLRKYFEDPWGNVLAFNAFADFTFGDPPFHQLAMLGGSRYMRGYYRGRVRDRKMMSAQMEYRFRLFWRLGASVFGTYGGVADEFENFALNEFRNTAGGGLRFLLDRKRHINIRLDAGFG